MNDSILRLKAFIAVHPDISAFASGASLESIAAAEAEMGITIPDDYKVFLTEFDGGFISLCGSKSDANWDESDARYGSLWLFGLQKLVEEFHEEERVWTLDRDWEGKWPYVPFCLVAGHDSLVFSPPDSGERSVIDAWHEWGPEQWKVLKPNFNAFLDALVEGRGIVDTVAKGQ